MKKRIFIAIALVIIAVFSLAACTQTQAATESSKVSMDDAISAALGTVGIKITDAEDLNAEIKEDSTAPYYEINFSYDGTGYEYKVDAQSGEVLSIASTPIEKDHEGTAEVSEAAAAPAEANAPKVRMIEEPAANEAAPANEETAGSSGAESAKTEIGIENAKKIALSDAGIKEAVFTQAKKGHDDGKAIYDIEFYANDTEYDYEIDVYTGDIHDKSIDKDDDVKKETKTQSSSSEGKTSDTASGISLKKAKSIALKDAGVSSSDAVFTQAKKDHDDGKAVYDIEFSANGKEYEYEIDAASGKIRDKNVEIDDDAPAKKKESSTSEISLKKAKSIALKHAGVSSGDAKFAKSETDTDDGNKYYNIEFTAGGYEYEYEVNANTGKITDYDKEKID